MNPNVGVKSRDEYIRTIALTRNSIIKQRPDSEKTVMLIEKEKI